MCHEWLLPDNEFVQLYDRSGHEADGCAIRSGRQLWPNISPSQYSQVQSKMYIVGNTLANVAFQYFLAFSISHFFLKYSPVSASVQ